MKFSAYVWLLLLFVAMGCRSSEGDPGAPGEHVAKTASALTTVDSRPGTGGIAPFGGHYPSWGQVITVPATDRALQTFGFQMKSVPSTAIFRGEVYAWDGTKATGPNLFESAPQSTTGATSQAVDFATGHLCLTAGAQYLLFATTSMDAGTGQGGWGFSNTNSYPGGMFVYSTGAPSAWTTGGWNTFGVGIDLAFAMTLDVPPAPGASTTSLVSSLTPAGFGDSVTFTASVTGSAGTASGTVTFKDGATTLGTAALDGAGQASLSVSTLPVGPHSITAVYGGGCVDLPSTSTGISQVVTKLSTTTALVSSTNPSNVDGSVTFTATLAVVAPGSGTPTGTVTFREGATVLGTGTLDGSGSATFSSSALPAGSHDIVADYGGDATFDVSSSPAATQVVNLYGASVAVASSQSVSTFASSVTFTATVSSAGSGAMPTGTISFLDGASSLASATLDGSGNAALSISGLSGGAHTIYAAYSGDAEHAPALGSVSQTVNAGSSTTTVASLTNPSVFGQSTTFTATVSGTGGTPSGMVTFADGASTLASQSLDGSGQASLTISGLMTGSHAITAHYSGDSSFAASASSAITQRVDRAATLATLASSSNPSTIGGDVTLTAVVSAMAPGAGVPSGTVTFSSDGSIVGTGALDASGIATFTTNLLGVGSHRLSAVYGADAQFSGCTTPFLSQVVNQAGAVATLGASPEPSTFGSSVTFTATVASTGTGGIPTGSVFFKEGVAVLGSAALDSSGVATFSTAALAGGSHSVSAEYGGDPQHTAASASVTHVVAHAASATSLVSSSTPSVFGQSITVTATVSSTATGAFTGLMTFRDGASVLGSAAVTVGGSATFSTSALAVATHPLSATYGGDTNYAPSTSVALGQVVGKADSAVAVVSSETPSLVQSSVTFTASVAAVAPGAGTRSGTVTFAEGSTTLGTGTLGADGTATFATTQLAAGAHSVVASYGGDGNFAASTSPPFVQSVSTDAPTIAVTSTASTTTFGQSASFTVTVTGTIGTPAGAVTFADGTVSLGVKTLDGAGAAVLELSTLAVGTHTITARYGGSATYAAATGTAIHVVGKAITSTTLASSLNPSIFGDEVTFTATVSGAPGAPGAAAPVTFLDGTALLGTVIPSGGVARLSTKALGLGGHAITATYRGDASFLSSTSRSLTENVQSASVPPDAGVGEPATSADAGAATLTAITVGNVDGGGSGCSVATSRTPRSTGGVAFAALAGVLALLVRRRRGAPRDRS